MKLGLTAFALALLFFACTPPFDATSYASDNEACVADSATRAAADVCRAAVRAKYGLPPRDGGTMPTEAGHD